MNTFKGTKMTKKIRKTFQYKNPNHQAAMMLKKMIPAIRSGKLKNFAFATEDGGHVLGGTYALSGVLFAMSSQTVWKLGSLE